MWNDYDIPEVDGFELFMVVCCFSPASVGAWYLVYQTLLRGPERNIGIGVFFAFFAVVCSWTSVSELFRFYRYFTRRTPPPAGD